MTAAYGGGQEWEQDQWKAQWGVRWPLTEARKIQRQIVAALAVDGFDVTDPTPAPRSMHVMSDMSMAEVIDWRAGQMAYKLQKWADDVKAGRMPAEAELLDPAPPWARSWWPERVAMAA